MRKRKTWGRKEKTTGGLNGSDRERVIDASQVESHCLL
jgi:hypothetical protein